VIPGADVAPVTVPLRSRRLKRVQLVQKVQHAVPALGLLVGGAESLRVGAHGFELVLAVAGIGISGLLGASIIRSLRAARGGHTSASHHGHGIDWTDIWVAGVLFTEAAETWHVRHHIARPVILSGVVTLVIGLLHGRLAARVERRRSLRLTDDHLIVGGKPFRKFTARWDEIKHIDMTEHEAVIHTHQGRRRRLNFLDLENAADVRAALEKAQQRLIPEEQQ
jgi:hypothetical protein